VLEAALFRHDRIPRDALDRRLDRVAFKVGNTHRVFRDDRDLAVAEEKDVACVMQNRRNVGGDEKFAIAETDYDRRSLAHCDDRVRFVGLNDRKRKDPAQFGVC
jgi:hypothetical protein